MPNFNQRGQMGEGAMTGRKMGRCGNFGAGHRYPTTQENQNTENTIYDNPQGEGQGLGRGRGRGMRRGMGQGMGMGRGMRNRFGQGQGGGMERNRGGKEMGQAGGEGRGMGRRFRDDIRE